jgi:hypothetical protein
MFNPHIQPILTFKTLELPIPNVLHQRTPRAQVVPRGATVTVPAGPGRSQARGGARVCGAPSSYVWWVV